MEECPQQWGEMSATVGEIEYDQGSLTVEMAIQYVHRLPLKVHGITCKKPIRF